MALPRIGWAQEVDDGRSDRSEQTEDWQPVTAPLPPPSETSSEAAEVAPASGAPDAPPPDGTQSPAPAPANDAPDSADDSAEAPEVAPTSSAVAADTGPSTQRITAIALTGLAFVGVAVGTSSAIHAVSRDRRADGECTPVCTVEGDRLQRESNKAATVAQIAFAVGLVAIGGAAYAWITEPLEPEAAPPVASPAWRFDLVAAPGEAGAWLGGTF